MFTRKNEDRLLADTLRLEQARSRELEAKLQELQQTFEAVKLENVRLQMEVKLSRQWTNLMSYDGTPQEPPREDAECG